MDPQQARAAEDTDFMISGYRDHAANERTFLAWVRTGIAVIAFGVVIEKLNLFVLALTISNSADTARRLQLERLSGPIGRYDGLALILLGLAMVALAFSRFIRTGHLLDTADAHAAPRLSAELILSVALAVIVGGFSTFFVLG
jgi:putative membrane protein